MDYIVYVNFEQKITLVSFCFEKVDKNYYGYIQVYFKDDTIKLAFLNGSIVTLKNGNITSIITRNLICSCVVFSPDGKMISYFRDDCFRFIHEDSDEYSNEFCLLKNSYIDNNAIISPDGKLFISKINNNFIVHDISFIGYKKCQKLQFLCGLNDKISNTNSFSNNVLFDINVVKIIFEFLPFSLDKNFSNL